MYFRKLFPIASAFALLFAGCGPVVEDEASLASVESELVTCGTGLQCTLSYTSGATYCQSGSQQVYCCPTDYYPSGGYCRSCWETRCRNTGTGWHDNYKVYTCSGPKNGQTCCWTTSPGTC